ncbi:hypothetical protein IWW34DRAFT_694149 [Fusarium oxysporum f. sp. albedinis]|uniref:Uncharacterized protein n=2 Tax=Fusarium oxysporum TaxID=5507 RepID=A0A2H3SR53_FUSOX|nr:hypothetical protein FOXYS1_3760 [Fusarium oxysporum]KAH7467808.1 hypothetical protein FOMA001_g15835 [Fusarium oxysporum f. sp. matthiolae]KAI3579834.1 hypothetical protein IWW34DRAFT_694149 [Fusarium oxysporum f. sp. albedinis]RYC86317.1 hypothetical protein BFJ63_vAg10840 [Fusarium oxysporum f. sp. narcissi]KAH7191584.1 hypothetical protein BKA60DRAFT_529640 [Fusarium oxysporum]
MSFPTKGDLLSVPAYTAEAEQNAVEISWSQSFRTRTARYYIVNAQNQSKGNTNVLMYIQDRYYKDSNSNEYIGKLPGARQEGNSWIVSITDRFQYGQKNKNGDGRWVALHDKDNKPYQHRFMIVTIQGKLTEAAKNLARSFGAGEIAEQVSKLGGSYIGDYLHTF